MELLSPVGSVETLMPAINAGCDAVYLSGKNFGARSFASNFSRDEIIWAIKTSHLFGVKVYVTINTLIYDIEVEKLLEYVDFLYRNDVDALIMQDIGMIDLVRKTYPKLEIHASTQLHIHNLEGVKFCESIGIKRAVLARETPIELVEEIKKNSKVEIEIFVHGALCQSYSGECLMSALIGSRSGNRGTCAQCCRQMYSLEIDNNLVEKNKYLLSTKDLNTLSNIGKLIDIGVDSFKIEGRMKRPEYVYLVTSLYRKAIDNYVKYKKTNITEEDILELKKVFNREFTKGFLFNEKNDNFTNTFRPNHMGTVLGKVIKSKNNIATILLEDDLNIGDGIRIIGKEDYGMTVTSISNNPKIKSAKKGDIISLYVKNAEKGAKVVKTTDYLQLKILKEKMSINKKIKISGICEMKIGNYVKLSITDGKNKVEKYSDIKVQVSEKCSVTKDDILSKLNKLGSSIYTFDKLNITIDDNSFIPMNVINELRRNAIKELDEKRIYKNEYIKEEYHIDLKDYKKEQKKSILLESYEEYEKYKDCYDIIYIDDYNVFSKIKSDKAYFKLDTVNEHLKEFNNTNLLVGDIGSVFKYKNVDSDFSLNVFNSYSVAFLHSIGVNKITLSYELNYKQIKFLIETYIKRYNKRPNLEVITDGYEQVMVCKYNLLKKYNTKSGYLIDRFNNKYKIVVKNNFMHIYNYKKRALKDNYYDIGVNSVRTNLI